MRCESGARRASCSGLRTLTAVAVLLAGAGLATPAPIELLGEDFEGVTPPALPAGWVVEDLMGDEGDWVSHAGTHLPSGAAAHGGTNLLYFNSADAAVSTTTGVLCPDVMNTSGFMSFYVEFFLYHDTESAADDRFMVYLTHGDAGRHYADFTHRYDGTTGWKRHVLDLGYVGADEPVVRLGFYGISEQGRDLHIDDLRCYGWKTSLGQHPDGTTGSIVRIYGSGFGPADVGGQVLLGEKTKLKIQSWSNTMIEGLLSKAPPPGDYEMRVLPKGGTEVWTPPYGIHGPEIGSFDEESGPAGAVVTITGSFFGVKKGKVLFGLPGGKAKKAKVLSWTMNPDTGVGTIEIAVPKLAAGLYDVTVLTKVGSATAAGAFTIED